MHTKKKKKENKMLLTDWTTAQSKDRPRVTRRRQARGVKKLEIVCLTDCRSKYGCVGASGPLGYQPDDALYRYT